MSGLVLTPLGWSLLCDVKPIIVCYMYGFFVLFLLVVCVCVCCFLLLYFFYSQIKKKPSKKPNNKTTSNNKIKKNNKFVPNMKSAGSRKFSMVKIQFYMPKKKGRKFVFHKKTSTHGYKTRQYFYLHFGQ